LSGRCAPILCQQHKVLIDQRHHGRVEADLIRCAGGWTPLGHSFNERIFGELAVPVVFVGRADAPHPVASPHRCRGRGTALSIPQRRGTCG
jgi:hypothetical protein